MSKYIYFEEIRREKKKTLIVEIYSFKEVLSLGTIKWNSQWRQYCLYPDKETIWSSDCLRKIDEKISELNKNHKTRDSDGIV